MSHVEAAFSLMLTTSRGKRTEHRVEKLELKQQTSPQSVLNWFSENALAMDLPKLEAAYTRAKSALSGHTEHEKSLDEVYCIRKKELSEDVQA
jgi:uncharacterized coiled-coil DUF342 family protein